MHEARQLLDGGTAAEEVARLLAYPDLDAFRRMFEQVFAVWPAAQAENAEPSLNRMPPVDSP